MALEIRKFVFVELLLAAENVLTLNRIIEYDPAELLGSHRAFLGQLLLDDRVRLKKNFLRMELASINRQLFVLNHSHGFSVGLSRVIGYDTDVT